MRILQVSHSYYPARGGAAVHARALAEGLAARGHDVTVFTIEGADVSGANPRESVECLNGVRVRRFHPAGTLHRVARRVQWRGQPAYLSRSIPAALQMVCSEMWSFSMLFHSLAMKPDLVAVINWYQRELAYQQCLVRNVRKRILVAIPLFHTEQPWASDPLYAPMLERCDAVLANTVAEKSHVQSVAPLQKRIRVTAVGIDPSEFAERNVPSIRQRFGLGSAPVIGFLGRLVPSKGVLDLIRAMPLVWREVPDARLLLAGAFSRLDSASETVQSALDSLSPVERGKVLWLPNFSEEEKLSILQAMDIFAMPSTGESFGIAYLEAWMCGKPVIGARISSTSRVIDEHVDGLLVEPGDPPGLAHALVSLLRDPERRSKMGESGRRKTLAQFTWDKVVDRVESLYLDLWQERRRLRSDSMKQEHLV